jgi:hypothetical protein
LLPRCNHNYATNNKNWHQWPSKQKFKLLAIVVVALVATITTMLANEIETK